MIFWPLVLHFYHLTIYFKTGYTKPNESAGDWIADKYIKNTLKELGYYVQFHDFEAGVPKGRRGSQVKKFRNIIARKDPAAKRYLTLVCHYDSKDCSSEPVCSGGGKFDFYGAIDSAVPCALLLDVATTLNAYMEHSNSRDLSLQLLFLDGEEAFRHWSSSDSIYGARALAEMWSNQPFNPPNSRVAGATELDRIDAFVLLDLLGTAKPTMKNFLHNLGRLYMELPEIESKLRAMPKCLKQIPQIFQASNHSLFSAIEDDHLPFMHKGVSIVHLIPQPFPSVWHTAADDREHLDMDTIYNLASIIRIFTAQYLHLLLPEDQVCEHWPCPPMRR